MTKSIERNNFKLHFIGIGGVSMSALALIARKMGFSVSGSDIKIPENILELENADIEFFCPHSKENLDLVSVGIYSLAIKPDNEEILHLLSLGTPLFSRAEFLALIEKGHENSVAVSGSHGKSTTTSMIYSIWNHSGLSPTLHLGAKDNLIKSNWAYQNGNYFITEACEYKRAFLTLSPKVAILLNVDFDHPDCYENLEDVKEAFKSFLNNATDCVILQENQKYLAPKKKKIITIGEGGDYFAKNIKQNGSFQTFDVYEKGVLLGEIRLNLLGTHNIENALFAIASSRFFEIEFEKIKEGLDLARGIERRMQFLGKYGTRIFFSDYAHHPRELDALFSQTKDIGEKRTIVFQPHTFSRTKALFESFITSLKAFDEVIIYKTYSAREDFDPIGSSQRLASALFAMHFDDETKLFEHLKKSSEENSAILFVGAGDIDEIAKKYIGTISRKKM